MRLDRHLRIQPRLANQEASERETTTQSLHRVNVRMRTSEKLGSKIRYIEANKTEHHYCMGLAQ